MHLQLTATSPVYSDARLGPRREPMRPPDKVQRVSTVEGMSRFVPASPQIVGVLTPRRPIVLRGISSFFPRRRSVTPGYGPTAIRQPDNRTAIAWSVTAGLAGLDIVWANHIGMSVHGTTRSVLTTVALLVLAAAYRHRCRPLADSIEAAALWMAFTAVGCVLTYLCAASARPLQDAALADFDHALGFDWAAWRDFVLRHPVVHHILAAVYASLLAQILFAIVFLPIIGRAERGIELLLLAMATILPVSAVSALYPALGPAPAGFGYLPDLLALRNPGPWDFNLTAMQGVVSMPSYHTTLAILFTYSYRGTGAVGWVIATLNTVMLPAIPPMGDHYLCDMLAGGGIAALAIAGLRLGALLRSTVPIRPGALIGRIDRHQTT